MTTAVDRPGLLSRIVGRWRRTPLPGFITNLLLMLVWRCLIHPLAKIEYPFALRLSPGVRIGRATLLCRGSGQIAIELGPRVIVHDGAILDAHYGSITIGADSTVNPYCVLYGTGGLSIGAYCGIATHTVIVAANHSHERTDVPMMQQQVNSVGVRIADDVWIGAGVRILDGVAIATGCIVAAGAVVTQSFDSGSVIGGVPARRIKYREGFEK